MDKRGQSALEYLMTYGWALIVIAIVIGVLIYVTGSTTGGVTCQSTSTGIILREWVVATGADNVGITIQNATGSAITINSFASGGDFAADTNALTLDIGVAANGTVALMGVSGPAAAGSFGAGTVTIDYTTTSGLSGSAVITCAGTV